MEYNQLLPVFWLTPIHASADTISGFPGSSTCSRMARPFFREIRAFSYCPLSSSTRPRFTNDVATCHTLAMKWKSFKMKVWQFILLNEKELVNRLVFLGTVKSINGNNWPRDTTCWLLHHFFFSIENIYNIHLHFQVDNPFHVAKRQSKPTTTHLPRHDNNHLTSRILLHIAPPADEYPICELVRLGVNFVRVSVWRFKNKRRNKRSWTSRVLPHVNGGHYIWQYISPTSHSVRSRKLDSWPVNNIAYAEL